MNKIKVIKTKEDHKEALEMVKALMERNPDSNSAEGEQLALLATLIEDYESNIFPESLPDPIEAILFRMEQANLKPIDLVPFIGSRSKVSEILSRKRPLTLSMMRALSDGLGIPAKVLLKEPDGFGDQEKVAWDQFPLAEMEKRGYFSSNILKRFTPKELIEKFFAPIGGSPSQIFALTRKTDYVRAARPMNKQALVAWSGYILKEGLKLKYPITFKKDSLDNTFMQNLVRLSVEEDAPLQAIELLKSIGIGLIIEPHFPKTYLDGAVIMTDKRHPIIGLTLRHDRVDNFWFTLMHELAHIALHYDMNANFYDDLDNSDSNKMESDADELAGSALIPRSKWENSPARLIPSPIAAQSLAKELGIHTAIVAGKMRHEGDRYQYLNTIISEAKVRKYFPHIKWTK